MRMPHGPRSTHGDEEQGSFWVEETPISAPTEDLFGVQMPPGQLIDDYPQPVPCDASQLC